MSVTPPAGPDSIRTARQTDRRREAYSRCNSPCPVGLLAHPLQRQLQAAHGTRGLCCSCHGRAARTDHCRLHAMVHSEAPDHAKQTNKNLRCGNRKGLLGRNDQTHHRMGPKTMESIPPSKRNTQADIQLRTRQTNHQQETDGCIQIKHNPEHQPSRMSSKSTAYVPPKTASTPTKANTQTCSYLDFNQFLIRRITRNICLRLRIKQIQILTCREQDIR